MTKSMSATIALVFAACLFAPVALAQSPTQQSAWVSGLGKDVPTCGLVTAPCRTFQYTHDHIIFAGGQILIKDPAGYGALTITKAISIINDGVGSAGIFAPSLSAITINAQSTDSIFIKGLSLDGAGTGSFGIAVNTAGSVTITGCTVTNFKGGNSVGIIISQDVTAPFVINESFFYHNNISIQLNVSTSSSIPSSISSNTISDSAIGIQIAANREFLIVLSKNNLLSNAKSINGNSFSGQTTTIFTTQDNMIGPIASILFINYPKI